jgi:hypothetical protein
VTALFYNTLRRMKSTYAEILPFLAQAGAKQPDPQFEITVLVDSFYDDAMWRITLAQEVRSK